MEKMLTNAYLCSPNLKQFHKALILLIPVFSCATYLGINNSCNGLSRGKDVNRTSTPDSAKAFMSFEEILTLPEMIKSLTDLIGISSFLSFVITSILFFFFFKETPNSSMSK